MPRFSLLFVVTAFLLVGCRADSAAQPIAPIDGSAAQIGMPQPVRTPVAIVAGQESGSDGVTARLDSAKLLSDGRLTIDYSYKPENGTRVKEHNTPRILWNDGYKILFQFEQTGPLPPNSTEPGTWTSFSGLVSEECPYLVVRIGTKFEVVPYPGECPVRLIGPIQISLGNYTVVPAGGNSFEVPVSRGSSIVTIADALFELSIPYEFEFSLKPADELALKRDPFSFVGGATLFSGNNEWKLSSAGRSFKSVPGGGVEFKVAVLRFQDFSLSIAEELGLELFIRFENVGTVQGPLVVEIDIPGE